MGIVNENGMEMMYREDMLFISLPLMRIGNKPTA